MKKLMFTLNAICIPTLLFTSLSVQGMEKKFNLAEWLSEKYLLLENIVCTQSQSVQYFEQKQLEPCNNTELPAEILSHIFSYCYIHNKNQVVSLERTIKNYINLRTICKNLLTFEKIGNYCKNYAQGDKNHVLHNVGKNINENTYERLRTPILVLIYAGASINSVMVRDCYSLTQAVLSDDTQMTEVLLKHDADPNIGEYGYPLLFLIKNLDILTLCLKSGLNVHATSRNMPINILWEVIRPSYPAKFLELYLEHGVDPNQRHPLDGSCLLHGLANTDQIDNVENFLKKANILLNALSRGMINTSNRFKQTPFDVAQASLETSSTPEALMQFMILLNSYGGCPAREL